MHDISKTVKIFNDFKDSGNDSWRIHVVFWSTILPPICLVLELFLGRLKVPIQQVSITIFFSLSYFLTAYCIEVAQDLNFPIYPNNLNWKCSQNQSYLVDVNDRTRVRQHADCSELNVIEGSGEVASLEECVNLVKRNQQDPLKQGCKGTEGEHFFYDDVKLRCGCFSLQEVADQSYVDYNRAASACTLYK